MIPPHVLVLDHDDDRRQRVVALLREAGQPVSVAADPRQACEALSAPGFDLLVLDLALPGLDGAALRQAIDPGEPPAPESLEAVERRHIALVLRHTGGNRRRAALLLGISRSTLLHKVRRYGLDGGG